MAWGYIAGAAISAFAGLSASEDSAEAMEERTKLMEKQLEFAKERWTHARDTYGDLEKQVVSSAERGVQGDYGGVVDRASADVSQAYERAREGEQRRLSSYGIDPGSGRDQATDRKYGIAEAESEAFAVNQARESERRWAEEETYDRRRDLYGMGSQIQDQAAQDVGRARGSLAAMHGQDANRSADLSRNLFSQAATWGVYGASQMDQPDSDNPSSATGTNWGVPPDDGNRSPVSEFSYEGGGGNGGYGGYGMNVPTSPYSPASA